MPNLMTKATYERLFQQMTDIQEKEIPRIGKAKQLAAEEGDLSENAEYLACKEKLDLLSAQLKNLRERLSGVSYIDDLHIPGTRVSIGTRVDYEDLEHDNNGHYVILGSEDADIENNIISISSPVARSMIGKKVDDIVLINVPEGSRKIKILSVRHFKNA